MIEIISFLGLCLTVFLTGYGHQAPQKVNFIISAFIAGSFFFGQISPYFDPKMKLFGVLLTVLILVGALVGGVVGVLLPKISTGLSLGFLASIMVAIFLEALFNGGNALTAILSSSLFIVILAGSVYLTQKLEPFCASLRTALAAGLALAMSIDVLFEQALIDGISDVLRTRSLEAFIEKDFSQNHLPLLMTVWVVYSGVAWVIQGMLSGRLKTFLRRGFTYAYQPVHVSGPVDSKAATAQQRTFSYPDALEFNYFDPDNLPEILTPYAETVFSTVQSLARQYGFQVDNSRNQAEHLLMMLTNESASNDTSLSAACTRLHSKVFANYRKWCDRMGTPPLFSKKPNGKLYATFIEDTLMFLLVWGEAANLRHMPESLCFLYHKMMQEHIISSSRGMSPSVYPGFFLDMVVTPMYEVVSASLKKGGDHDQKKTYDDFNEFFWSPSCIRYRIHDSFEDSIESGLGSGPANGASGASGAAAEDTHVARAMQEASKTYVEKRSWLHPLISLHRVFEWHAVTFTMLVAASFAFNLVWTWAFTFQVMSFVFWEITFFHIIWTCLEVWTLFPSASISGPSICGFLIRLIAGYLVLIYQSVYYQWSFSDDVPLPGAKTVSIDKTEAQFWWWQFLWISFFSQSIYFLESFLCYAPSIVSSLMTWNNDIWQAILNICYPTSQLFVGKKIDVSQKEVYTYITYWLTLIAFKLWFGYRYVVGPVALPAMQLYDDYMNYQKISFAKTSILMFCWYFPHFLVYLIDLSIWYSVWSSIVGGFVALVDRQGAVRDSRSFRAHFMRSPLAFCQKVMPVTSSVGCRAVGGSLPSTTSLTALTPPSKTVIAAAVATANTNANLGGSKPHRKAASSADLAQLFASESAAIKPVVVDVEATSGWNEFGDSYQKGGKSKDHVTEFLDVRSQRWVIFAKVWNEIIHKLRESDHVSDSERETLLFSAFDWLSKPIYLPLYQTAGCVEIAMYAYKEASAAYHEEKEPEKKVLVLESFDNSLDVTTKEAVSELWELIGWVLVRLLGSVHQTDTARVVKVLTQWAASDDIFTKFTAEAVSNLSNQTGNIIGMLKGTVGKRKKSPVVTPDILARAKEAAEASEESEQNSHSIAPNFLPSGLKKSSDIRKSVSTGFLSALESVNELPSSSEANTAASAAKPNKRFAKLQPFRQNVIFTDNVRDKIREELRSLFNNLRNALRVKSGISHDGQDVIDRITFILSMESGFLWNDVYASMQLDELAHDARAPSVLAKANGLLRLRQTQVELGSPEANRRLNFFLNTLFMDMPHVPSMRWSKEYTVMTPFYSEDVLLTRDDLEAKNSDGVSTILYLQTLYKKDWLNFLERRGLTDDQHVWSSKHQQAIRMWASLRAQTLFRTVEGMMQGEAAVRLLAELEQNTSVPDFESLTKLKFNYVVACQVYGQMRKNLEHKADDIEFLLARHPNLRVAYIDAMRVNREGDMTFYSVLIKHDPHAAPGGVSTKGHGVKEVYRLKLPGNPVLGEGKPENQNHAIVFSRGRYLQAIDMNQDGYFEEAIKMRNMLQEFDSGCSILGFREHIFTGSISSVANYMALQELSFVTLGQRVLNQPLRIRQHYGHPDLFDKLFVMTEGGMSKASRGINLSEDVFAGFNATIRGHSVQFKEYVQAGKGRDVGLQQTYKFEAKLSQGNAEQSLSRDMYRICDRLDFFRLMSFYYGGIGHYIANTMVMFTLVVVVYTMLALAIFNEEGVNGRPMHPEGVLQLLLSGMGLLQTMPLCVTLTVEKGFFSMLSEITYMIISGGPLYFIFHIQTKCYYFQQTLLAGGAMYRPTGRGFVIRHSPFDENYRFFATSHIYLGMELMAALLLFALYTTSKQYGGLTWSLWMTVVAFILGPFWFNPVTFEWNKLTEDYVMWMRWMTETGGTAEQSWEVWWKEENGFFKNLSASWKTLLVVQKCVLWAVIGGGVLGARFFRDSGEQFRVLELLILFSVFYFGHWVLSKLERSLSYAVRRFASLTLSTGIGAIAIVMYITHSVYVRYSIGIYYMVSSIAFACLLSGANVTYLYKMHDYLVGHVIFVIIGVLSTLQIGYVQTWLLYHNALSYGVVIDDVLKFARKSKERAGDEVDIISELRNQLAEQDRTIRLLVQRSNSGVELTERSGLLSGNTTSDKSPHNYGSTGVSMSDVSNRAALEGITATTQKTTVNPAVAHTTSAMKSAIHHAPVATIATAPQPSSLTAQRSASFVASGPVSASSLAALSEQGTKPVVPSLALGLGLGSKTASGAGQPSSAPNSARGAPTAPDSARQQGNGAARSSDFVFAQPSTLPPREKF